MWPPGTSTCSRQLSNSTTLQIAYVANRGIKLFSHRDINQSDPSASFNCYNNGDDTIMAAGRIRALCLTVRGASPGPAMPLNWRTGIFVLQRATSHADRKNFPWPGFARRLHLGARARQCHQQSQWLPPRQPDICSGVGQCRLRHSQSLYPFHELQLPQFRAPLQMGRGWQLSSISICKVASR